MTFSWNHGNDDVDFEKDVDIDVEFDGSADIDLEFDLDVEVDICVDVDVDVEGNYAAINFDATAVGDDSSATADVYALATDDMSEVYGSLTAIVG